MQLYICTLSVVTKIKTTSSLVIGMPNRAKLKARPSLCSFWSGVRNVFGLIYKRFRGHAWATKKLISSHGSRFFTYSMWGRLLVYI